MQSPTTIFYNFVRHFRKCLFFMHQFHSCGTLAYTEHCSLAGTIVDCYRTKIYSLSLLPDNIPICTKMRYRGLIEHIKDYIQHL